MSGVRGLVQGVLKLPGAIINGPKAPGAPPVQEDPQTVLADEAIQSSIAGDIAARNAQRQSSTLGSGANFLATSTTAGPGLLDTGPVGFEDQRPEVVLESETIKDDQINRDILDRKNKGPAAGAGRRSLSQRLGR